MATNLTSRIANQSTIYHAQSLGLEVAGLPRSPKANKDGRSSTKAWVLRSFYSASKIATKNPAPAAKPALDYVKIQSPKKVSAAPTTEHSDAKATAFEKSPARKVPSHESEPVVFLEQSDIDAASKKFEFSLVGKFPRRRPSLELIRAWVGREWKLKGLWSITLLDSKHVLVRLDNEADMICVWLRSRWFIDGHLMRVFKWTPSFRASDAEEPSLAAVWISFPLLPVAFFEKDLLHSIASVVGRVVCTDGPTKNLSRTNVARVCVEVDLLKELPRRVRIVVGEAEFLQDISYEKLPFYCASCRRLGHSTSICKFNKAGAEADKSVEDVVNVDSHLEKPNAETKRQDCLEEHVSENKLYQTCPVFRCVDVNNSITKSSSQHAVNLCMIGESSKNRSRVEVEPTTGERNFLPSRPNKKPKNSNTLARNGSRTQGIDEQSSTHVLDKADSLQFNVCHHLDSKLDLKEKTIMEEEGDDDDNDEVSGDHDRKENQRYQEARQTQLYGATENNSRFKFSVKPSPSSRKKFTLDKPIFFWKRKTKEVYIGRLKEYSLKELRVATKDFSNVNILGRGGFGKVYKGQLPDGSLVAIKRLREERTSSGLQMFQTEVEMCSKAVHRNILQLRGFCVSRNERLLVYPYMANGSVAARLRERPPSEPPLSWPVRKRIALGSARGLAYLHDHCDPKIIHRDVKAANILLDENYEAVVGDFGLVKFMNIDDSHVTTAVRGTVGHIAPEYLSTGKVTEKTDVFGYGIMLLELVTGQRAFDLARLANDEDVLLLDWVKWLFKEKRMDKLVDSDLQSNYVEVEVEQLILVALLCTQGSPMDRPKMLEVLRMLEDGQIIQQNVELFLTGTPD